MTETALLRELNGRLKQLLDERAIDNSPYLPGDQVAANFAGYRSRKAFRNWADQAGIKPSKEEGINFWSKTDIAKARDRNKF